MLKMSVESSAFTSKQVEDERGNVLFASDQVEKRLKSSICP